MTSIVSGWLEYLRRCGGASAASSAPGDLRSVVQHYEWSGAGLNFDWAEEELLSSARGYLLHWGAGEYWDVICTGGVRGYSLFLHEWIELASYATGKHNPFVEEEQVFNYPTHHARALLAEHRFLQTVASLRGHAFSLRDLVEHNPHGDPPEYDWQLLHQQLGHQLPASDCQRSFWDHSEVEEFYARLGFVRLF